jgi:hypothetical protein
MTLLGIKSLIILLIDKILVVNKNMNLKLFRNLGIAAAVVITVVFGIGLIDQQELENIDSMENQIKLWIECRNSPNGIILESYPATCIADDLRVKQPLIEATESEWNECINLENSLYIDEKKQDRCITENNVVYYQPQ